MKSIDVMSFVRRAGANGFAIAISCLFWFIVILIVLVATASSKSPWDTVIAGFAMIFTGLAMLTQAFFAFMVWQLAENQYAFTQQVANRQHKIDMFPLRKAAMETLSTNSNALFSNRPLSDDVVEAFRVSHQEIRKLFSETADELAFRLYELAEESLQIYSRSTSVYDFSTGTVSPNDPALEADAHAVRDDAINVFTDLQNALDDEMRIQ